MIRWWWFDDNGDVVMIMWWWCDDNGDDLMMDEKWNPCDHKWLKLSKKVKFTVIILPITQKSTHRGASLAGFSGIIWLTGITEMHGFLTCWDSEFLLVMPHYGFRNASASEKLQIAVSNIYLQFFSHDRSKKALGNHSTRLGDGKLELFPGLSFTYLIFVKPHKHICVNFCPVWIFTELTQKSGILTGFTRTSGIFTDLTQKVDAFWYK